MLKFILYCCVLLLLGGVVLFALSPQDESGLEKGAADKLTDEAAQQLVDNIRNPIEKARSLKKQEDSRVREAEDALPK